MVFRGTRSQVLDDKNAVLKNCPKFTGNMKAVGFSAVVSLLLNLNKFQSVSFVDVEKLNVCWENNGLRTISRTYPKFIIKKPKC